jgi:DNA polymerase III epsilon subunit-like protein
VLDLAPGGSDWAPEDLIDVWACEAFDLESALIRAGLCAPPPVCAAFYRPNQAPHGHGLYEMRAELVRMLGDQRVLVVVHNVAYDFCLILEWFPDLRELVFEAYDADRVLDTGLAQRIIEIETGDKRGKLSLQDLCRRYGIDCEKPAERTDYGRFIGCRFADLPEGHRKYALQDPEVTWLLFKRLIGKNLVRRRDLAELGRNDLALKLVSAFGLCTDAQRVEKLEANAKLRLAELQQIMLDEGLMRWERHKPMPVQYVKKTKCLVADAYDIPVDADGVFAGDVSWVQDLQNQGLLTDGGKSGKPSMSTSRLVLEESGDPLLMSLADYKEWSAVWNKDLRLFRHAHEIPFHTRFGFAATLRTTSGGPNIQNFRKKEGIRECIVARYGALVASDYTGLENGTLAQVIVNTLGRRTMADKISAGWNFHAEVGSYILNNGMTPEEVLAGKDVGDEACKQAYNAAKPLNFGLPGYMSRASTVQSYARIGYGVNLPTERWQELMDLWYDTQHDQVAYLHEYVDALKTGDGRGALYNVPIPGTLITRRGATRTAAANTGFQGLGGRVAERGLYYTVRAQMLGLMPGKVCAFIHDEEISDCSEQDVEEVRFGQEHWMGRAAEELMADVRMKIESVAMRHWSKKAKHRQDEKGRLLLDLTH